MLEVIILALALSMDAFAVSIGLGSKHVINAKSLSLSAAIYFGVFQGIMPLIGYLGGQGLFGLIGSFAHWIAFILLLFIGAKMVFEAVSECAIVQNGTCWMRASRRYAYCRQRCVLTGLTTF